jgi:quinol monooxygenase YgiN
MTVARFYEMRAVEGKQDDLEVALRNLADCARSLAGCEGVELLRDKDDDGHFFLIEKWVSADVHRNARAAFPNETVAPAVAAMASQNGAYLDYLKTL